MSDQHLGVFAKYWEPGRVKTRLAKSIGKEKAALVYQAFVETTLARLSTLDNRKVLSFTPESDAVRQEFSSVVGNTWLLEPQSEGDLGLRMKAFFANRLEQGAKSVVLVGTDSPNLPVSLVERSFRELDEHDVVLGPTEDSGYYLMGISRTLPPIFDSMPWSTGDLWQATINRLDNDGIRYAILEPWYDVDEPADLRRIQADLASSSTDDPALQRLTAKLEEILAP